MILKFINSKQNILNAYLSLLVVGDDNPRSVEGSCHLLPVSALHADTLLVQVEAVAVPLHHGSVDPLLDLLRHGRHLAAVEGVQAVQFGGEVMEDRGEDVVPQHRQLGALALHAADQEDGSLLGRVSHVANVESGLVLSFANNCSHLGRVIIIPLNRS